MRDGQAWERSETALRIDNVHALEKLDGSISDITIRPTGGILPRRSGKKSNIEVGCPYREVVGQGLDRRSEERWRNYVGDALLN